LPILAVIPLTTSGLHCGCGAAVMKAANCPSSCRPSAGSIAATGRRRPCSPAAPSSRRSTGGLHCGAYIEPGGTKDAEVIPPFTGGLHCGTSSVTPVITLCMVVPLIVGGLHCGNFHA
jgi:hypothetical protein